MNQHNNSLGNCSTKGVPLNSTNEYNNNNEIVRPFKANKKGNIDLLAASHGGVEQMRLTLEKVKHWIQEQNAAGRRPKGKLQETLDTWILNYEKALKSSVGMPTGGDSVTTQRDATKDIPTMPLSGYQLLQRKCYIVKLASGGTTAGGFYAELKTTDLAPFLTGTSPVFRVSKVSSWTTNTAVGSFTGFAGVSVYSVDGSQPSDSITPIWSENWTPVGQGYAGIETHYPTGDFPYYADNVDKNIVTHFTALGGTGGVTGVPVVFHVTIEYLL